jgi:hypothetical protein
VFDLPTLASVNHQFDPRTPGGPNNDAANGAKYGPPARRVTVGTTSAP